MALTWPAWAAATLFLQRCRSYRLRNDGEDEEHWRRASRVEGRVVLAGGLTPENVAAAAEAVGPWAVDASRSLEAAPGVKDHARVRAFVDAVRAPEAVRA